MQIAFANFSISFKCKADGMSFAARRHLIWIEREYFVIGAGKCMATWFGQPIHKMR